MRPKASNVLITGTPEVGQTLTGSYIYTDANADTEGVSTFKWYANGAVIAGANAKTYTLNSSELGKTIQFEVTPVAQTGVKNGSAVKSAATATVINPNEAPTASSVLISGTAQVGETLTGSYTYTDADSDTEGTSTFQWYADNVAILGATSKTFTLTTSEEAKTIQFEVTPVAQTGNVTGLAIKSATTNPVTP
ncbi:hypothetical protein [Brevibacillus choshinensis]|uniref:hypothetical protein n=1 Tax=Brevibacillus choshinensis TaxID=54911 RepID=UPI002E1F641E|nr:hypothetical protein [Brevibacillus choshinensis]